MSRINPVDRETTVDRLRKTFDAIQSQLGVVPAMMRTMAQSPAVLDAYLAFGAALQKYFANIPDEATLALLNSSRHGTPN